MLIHHSHTRAVARFLVCSFCFLPVFGLSTAFAQTLTCGAVITQSTVLRANLGPCPQVALTIPAGANHVTVDLNGHTIIGTGAGGSVGIDVRAGMVTIQGPGTIARFNRGIQIIVPANWWEPRGATIQRVRFESNANGIWIEPDQYVESYGMHRILRNVINGPGQIGIRIDRTHVHQILNNAINGHSDYGILANVSRYIEAAGNTVAGNGTGMHFDYWSDHATITGNTVSENRLDGIHTLSRGPIIEDNVVSRNGRDGMALTQIFGRVRDNRAFHNGRWGIALVRFDDTPGNIMPDTFHVSGNDARQNGVDLYWDGTGVRNCWVDNKFGTSQPARLPVCP